MENRKTTNKILELVSDGVLDAETVLAACLASMSEREVYDMAEAHEFLELNSDDDITEDED